MLHYLSIRPPSTMSASVFSGTQLSLLRDTPSHRPPVVTARMASHVLLRLMGQVGSQPSEALASPSAETVFFQVVFPLIALASERLSGLPVTKTTLRPLLENPAATIASRPPTRPEELEATESLLEFVNRRLSTPADQTRHLAAVGSLLHAQVPEVLITQDGIPSPLFARDRQEASELFASDANGHSKAAAECLIEAYVLLRANHCDVRDGIAKLFWPHGSDKSAEPYLYGCADGRARAFFRDLLLLPERQQRELFSQIDFERFYSLVGE